MTGYAVVLDELREHARLLWRLSERLRRAAEATTPLESGAYGLIGRVFAASTGGAEGSIGRAVARLAQAVTADAGKIEQARAGYLEAESSSRSEFERIGRAGATAGERAGQRWPPTR